MELIPKAHKNEGEFSLKLSKYSALTFGGVAGTMAVFESGEAAMIVTNTSIVMTHSTATAPTTAINLNGVNGPPSLLDGTDDVQVTVFSASILEGGGLNGGSLAGTFAANPPPSNWFYPTMFQAPSTIGPALGFGASSTNTLGTFGTLANGSTIGNWGGVASVSGYLGVEFQINSNDHYGWVHVTWDPTADTATIDQYAYNGVAGAAALVPEPSTLAMLGLGAVGLAARRRRRSEV